MSISTRAGIKWDFPGEAPGIHSEPLVVTVLGGKVERLGADGGIIFIDLRIEKGAGERLSTDDLAWAFAGTRILHPSAPGSVSRRSVWTHLVDSDLPTLALCLAEKDAGDMFFDPPSPATPRIAVSYEREFCHSSQYGKQGNMEEIWHDEELLSGEKAVFFERVEVEAGVRGGFVGVMGGRSQGIGRNRDGELWLWQRDERGGRRHTFGVETRTEELVDRVTNGETFVEGATVKCGGDEWIVRESWTA